MISTFAIGAIVLGPVWGFLNMILTSKLQEYRIDLDVERDGGMGRDVASVARRLDRTRYSPRGQALLPWVVTSGVAQLLGFVGWLWFAG